MGIYRLLLSIAVASSHLYLFRYNQGAIAVTSFFLMSGYVMTGLIRTHYASRDRIPAFYADRVMRLFPQFFFYSTVALAAITIGRPSNVDAFTPLSVLLNYLMLPLGFVYLASLDDPLLLPQAWSLGLELCFYLLFPLIVIWRLRLLAFVLSGAIFFATFAGVFPDPMAYRWLPGTLFIFLIGSRLYDLRERALDAWIPIAVIIFIVMWAVTPLSKGAFLPDVLFGLVIGIPIVRMLRHASRSDDWAGNIAYGVFLNHYILIWVTQAAGLNTASAILFTLGLTVPLAWLTFVLIERPVLKIRRRLRTPREQRETIDTLAEAAAGSRR